jgi:hypothetical protein
MRIINLLLLVMLCCVGCKSKKQEITGEKFDKARWAIRDGKHYPYRDKMLHDLITNYKLHGLKQDSIINLLGQPNREDNGHLFYTVDQSFIANAWPLHTKTLVIKFTKDSTVEWRKIHE